MICSNRLLKGLKWFSNPKTKTDTEATAVAHRGACKILAENPRRTAKDEQFPSLVYRNPLCSYGAPIPIQIPIA